MLLDDHAMLTRFIINAAADIRAQAGLALLTQTVAVSLNESDSSRTINFGVGPGSPNAEALVSKVDDLGIVTVQTSGFRFGIVRWHRLHLTENITIALVVDYTADITDDTADLPGDLLRAFGDQVRWPFDTLPERGTRRAPAI